MYILISLHKRIKVGVYRQIGIVSLKLPFVTIDVFPQSFNQQIFDTFQYVNAGKKFVAVGSGEWNDTLDERTKVMCENWDKTETRHWNARAELREELSKTQAENSTLKRTIKIVGGSDE